MLRATLGLVLLITSAQRVGQAQSVYRISTVSGSDWVGDGGPAVEALLTQAEGVAVSPDGDMYVADAAESRVRKVSPNGVIRTVAGTGTSGFSGDGGLAVSAQLQSPYGLALDREGNLYVADLGNGRVRRVGSDGRILTLAQFVAPRNLAIDAKGTLYVSDFTRHRVYSVDPAGNIGVIAGTGVAGYSGDGGPAANAQLSFPAGLAVDGEGSLYIADSQNNAIRKVSQGIIQTVIRWPSPTGVAIRDGSPFYIAAGSLILRMFSNGYSDQLPVAARDVAIAPDGTLYAASGNFVRKILPQGLVLIAAGGGDPAHGDHGDAALARLNQPSGAAVDALGNVYIADQGNHRIRRVSATGEITTFAGTGEAGSMGLGGPARQAMLHTPAAVSVDPTGTVWIADTGNKRICAVTPQGQLVPVRNNIAVTSVISDGAGTVYAADERGVILKLSGDVAIEVASGLRSPRGLALDGTGNLYFTETDAARVRRITPDGQMADLAPGTWKVPRGVAVDSSGNLFVADSGRQQILRVDPDGSAMAVAGNGWPGFSGDGGPALAAQFRSPWDIAAGPGGRLYVADLENNRVRLLQPADAIAPEPVLLAQVVNAASQLAGPVAPGMLLEIVQSGLSAEEMAQAQFRVGGLAAQAVAKSPDRIVIQAPDEVPVGGTAVVEVLVGTALRLSLPMTLAPSAPGLFPTILNQEGSVNSGAQPAAQGSIVVLFGTGRGVEGLPVSTYIGGQAAAIDYAGPVAGYPGLFQINARIPAGVTGAVPVIVRIGEGVSQAGVLVQVQ